MYARWNAAAISFVSALSFTFMATAMAFAQSVMKAAPLVAPNATLAEEFARVISVRELRDGRVLISEGKENRLAVGDFAANVAKAIGRNGNGPGEYTVVGRLWPLGGDSSFMSEPYRNRWHIIVGDKIVSTTSDVNALRKFPGQIPRGITARRDIFATVYPRGTDGKASMRDSTLLVRVAWNGVPFDTVAHFSPIDMSETREPVRAASVGSGVSTPAARKYMISVEARDQTVVFPDGSFAIVRGNPYRVDWCVIGKICATGKSQSGDRPSMTTADQNAYRKVIISVSRTSAREQDQMDGWPDKLPPFHTPGGPDEASVWATAKGNVVVERVPTAASPTYSYDVIDRAGSRVAVVSVPFATYVIGFGAKSVYTVKTDADGIQRVQRHAWVY